jgi:hypothetical protein
MRQKYLVIQDGKKKLLKIREYAVIDKDLKKVAATMLCDDDFSLLCEETYEEKLINASISDGLPSLIMTLRTHNFFPIEPYAAKIAESVMALYDKKNKETSVELFFDDVDLFEAAEAES